MQTTKAAILCLVPKSILATVRDSRRGFNDLRLPVSIFSDDNDKRASFVYAATTADDNILWVGKSSAATKSPRDMRLWTRKSNGTSRKHTTGYFTNLLHVGPEV